MNPVVLIATHNRIDITSRNIESLLNQSVVPKIVIVASKDSEINYYRAKYPQIIVTGYGNNPLGAKWQAGVDRAKELLPDPLIITGSDDILGKGFIESACRNIEEGNHFIGLQRFYIHYNHHKYLIDYLAMIPLGGGRIYSLKMLEKINWQVFDVKKAKHLDDYGFAMVKRSELKVKWVRDIDRERLEVHAIKGDWDMLNPFNPQHKNVKIIKVEPDREWGLRKIGPDFAHDDLGLASIANKENGNSFYQFP